jgi:hypothetical protein
MHDPYLLSLQGSAQRAGQAGISFDISVTSSKAADEKRVNRSREGRASGCVTHQQSEAAQGELEWNTPAT